MDTNPFGAPPASRAPLAAALPQDAPRRSWARSPRVLVGGGLGALALAGAFVLATGGSDPYATAAGPVPPAAGTPTATATTPVVPAGVEGRNPFFALVAATTTAGATAGATAAPTGPPPGSVVGAGTSTGASGAVRAAPAASASSASRVVVVPGPVVTQRVEVPVPGPTVTAPAPAPVPVLVPAAATVELTYLGPDAGVPGGQRFRVSSAGVSSVTTLQPGQAVSAVAPASWLVFTRIGDGGHAVVTGGARAYDLAVGVPVQLS